VPTPTPGRAGIIEETTMLNSIPNQIIDADLEIRIVDVATYRFAQLRMGNPQKKEEIEILELNESAARRLRVFFNDAIMD
jgi:hypothetical protein